MTPGQDDAVLRLFAPASLRPCGGKTARGHTGWSHGERSGWRVTDAESYTGCKLRDMQNHSCRASSKNLISRFGKLWSISQSLPHITRPSMESRKFL